MPAPRVKSLGYVKLNGTSASALEAVAKSRKSLNTSNGLALLLVFHEMAEGAGVEPASWESESQVQTVIPTLK